MIRNHIEAIAKDVHCSYVQNRNDETLATLASVPTSLRKGVLDEVTQLMDNPDLLHTWKQYVASLARHWEITLDDEDAAPLLPVDLFSDLMVSHQLDIEDYLDMPYQEFQDRQEESTCESWDRTTGNESSREQPAKDEEMTSFNDFESTTIMPSVWR